MNHAETFAMARKGVMEAAPDIDAEAILQSALRRKNRSACREPESLDDRLRIRNFQAHAFAGAELIVVELVHPFARVHAQNILVSRRFWCEDIRRLGNMLGEQEIAHHSEFLRLEDVLAQLQIVTFVIDKLER